MFLLDLPKLSDITLLRYGREAMATKFEVIFPYGTKNALFMADSALDLIVDFERWMTVYDEESEVCQLNENAFAGPVVVSELLFELLQKSAEISARTNFAFDPACGSMIKAWGFYRREGRLPNDSERATAMNASGMRHIMLDERNRIVRFLKPGIELNFGSVGKGFALDHAAKLLQEKFGVECALLHGGGSSVRAIGQPPNDHKGWPIAIQHPDLNISKPLQDINLNNNALGTSAATFQFFEHDGKKYGHVLDPRTGLSAGKTASASVIAPSATEADALSTAAFVLGSTAFELIVKSDPAIKTVILDQGKKTN